MTASGANPANRKKAGKPPPRCEALLLCQEAIEDPASGEFSLFHVKHSLRLAAFPGPSPPFAVFVQLYDGIGVYDLTIEVRDLAGDVTVARTTVPGLDFPERLVTMDLAVAIQSLGLPHPGRYVLVASIAEQELARQHFLAEAEDGEEAEEG